MKAFRRYDDDSRLFGEAYDPNAERERFFNYDARQEWPWRVGRAIVIGFCVLAAAFVPFIVVWQWSVAR